MLCGTTGHYLGHLNHVCRVIGPEPGVGTVGTMQMLILPERQVFFCDTHVNREPDAQQLAELTLMAAEQVTRFGLTPRVALVSHSSFGSSRSPSARKMRAALAIIHARAPGLEVDGEMRADAALSSAVRDSEFPDSRLQHDANLLIMPNVDAANITFNALRIAAGSGVTVGGILLGVALPVHILTPSSTVRRIVDMTALAAADAGVLATARAAARPL
jgi:malate dehydrogenase (oxaloacetate-decarboxylating)(NADP+)